MWHIFIIVVNIFVFKIFALYEYVLKKLHDFFFVYIVKILFFSNVYFQLLYVYMLCNNVWTMQKTV